MKKITMIIDDDMGPRVVVVYPQVKNVVSRTVLKEQPSYRLENHHAIFTPRTNDVEKVEISFIPFATTEGGQYGDVYVDLDAYKYLQDNKHIL